MHIFLTGNRVFIWEIVEKGGGLLHEQQKLVLQQYIEISIIYSQTLASPIIDMKFLILNLHYAVFKPRFRHVLTILSS